MKLFKFIADSGLLSRRRAQEEIKNAMVTVNDELILGTTDYSAPDTVFLFNSSNELLQTFEVNVLPGDFAVYNN